jgi:predicted transposase YdaD
VPILQGGGEQIVVQQAVQLLRQDEQLSELEPLLAFFASFVLGTELVAQIMRWDMTVLRESPWYEEIRKEEGRSLVLRILARKIGSIPTGVLSQIESLPLPELENLGEALLDFSNADDLIRWLHAH